MSKTLYKSDLIKALKHLPADAPIWLGVDSGEGYSVALLNEVFVCNVTDAHSMVMSVPIGKLNT